MAVQGVTLNDFCFPADKLALYQSYIARNPSLLDPNYQLVLLQARGWIFGPDDAQYLKPNGAACVAPPPPPAPVAVAAPVTPAPVAVAAPVTPAPVAVAAPVTPAPVTTTNYDHNAGNPTATDTGGSPVVPTGTGAPSISGGAIPGTPSASRVVAQVSQQTGLPKPILIAGGIAVALLLFGGRR